jgi:hypothetical protein
VPEALRDPTGIGEAASSSPSAAGEGAPAPDDDAIFDEETGTRELASLPTGPLPGEAGRDDDADESRGDFDDEDGDDEDESDGFIADQRTAALEPALSKQMTASLPAQPMELPSDALQPLPSQRMQVPPHLMGGASGGAPAVAPPMVPSIPGQSLVTPGAPGSAPAFTRPPGTGAGGVMGLPGGGATRPPILAKPAAPRPSAQSTVGFEQARKAEKIFEQAMKDHAEGRTSSARMNAKLASQFDPSVPAYKEFLESLDAAAPKPGSVKPRELVLFEEASNAEGRGDYERAAELLQQAIDINGKAAALYNRLGVVLSIRLKRHEEALAHLKKAIELEPGSLVYMNNFSKVTAMLESALEKDPEARKGKKDGKQEKVAIKKMRPKMF